MWLLLRPGQGAAQPLRACQAAVLLALVLTRAAVQLPRRCRPLLVLQVCGAVCSRASRSQNAVQHGRAMWEGGWAPRARNTPGRLAASGRRMPGASSRGPTRMRKWRARTQLGTSRMQLLGSAPASAQAAVMVGGSGVVNDHTLAKVVHMASPCRALLPQRPLYDPPPSGAGACASNAAQAAWPAPLVSRLASCDAWIPKTCSIAEINNTPTVPAWLHAYCMHSFTSD